VSELRIGGMGSVHCARAVYTALAGVEGIHTAEVVVGRATVEHDGRTTPEALRAAVALAGFTVSTIDERRATLPLL
jgi:copper chaperone CopZ